MNGWDAFDAALARHPVILILRGVGSDDALAIADRALSTGVGAVEITLETDVGRAALRAVAARAGSRGLLVGAGTVRTVDDVRLAQESGARFAVSPGLPRAAADAATASGLPFLPGVATPTECLAALEAGFTRVKAFPASLLTPGWVRAVAAPLPELRVVATGGVQPATAAAFLSAGCVAVGISVRTPDEVDAVARVTAGAG